MKLPDIWIFHVLFFASSYCQIHRFSTFTVLILLSVYQYFPPSCQNIYWKIWTQDKIFKIYGRWHFWLALKQETVLHLFHNLSDGSHALWFRIFRNFCWHSGIISYHKNIWMSPVCFISIFTSKLLYFTLSYIRSLSSVLKIPK